MRHPGFSIFLTLLTQIIFPAIISNTSGAGSDEKDKKKHCEFFVVEPETLKLFKSALETCQKKTGYAEDFPKFDKVSKLEDFNYDDKCHFQCIYKEMDMVSDAGMIKVGATATSFKSNMTKETLKKGIEYWDSCIEDVERIQKDKGSDQCKTIAMHTFCVGRKAEDMMKECSPKADN